MWFTDELLYSFEMFSIIFGSVMQVHDPIREQMILIRESFKIIISFIYLFNETSVETNASLTG